MDVSQRDETGRRQVQPLAGQRDQVPSAREGADRFVDFGRADPFHGARGDPDGSDGVQELPQAQQEELLRGD